MLMSSLTAFMQCVHVARTNTSYRCDIKRVANEIASPSAHGKGGGRASNRHCCPALPTRIGP